MGMLTNEDLIRALITNLEQWDWKINNGYCLTEDEGCALLALLKNSTSS